MNKRLIAALVIIVLFAGFAVYSFQSSLNPYVTFAESLRSGSRSQVMGFLVAKEQIGYNPDTGLLNFLLEDEEGTRALVVYDGARPNNFEHAESVVVIGKFNGEVFVAEKLLVKCPSKYEEQD